MTEQNRNPDANRHPGREKDESTLARQRINDPEVQKQYDEMDEPVPDADLDQYGNLDEPDMDLYGNLEDLEMVQDSDPDAATQDQYGSQNPIGSSNEPDTPGGEGLYDVQDQYGSDTELVRPGSDRDQYGTKGSQDQYGDQQNIE